MAYIVGTDRYQTRMITTSLDDLIALEHAEVSELADEQD